MEAHRPQRVFFLCVALAGVFYQLIAAPDDDVVKSAQLDFAPAPLANYAPRVARSSYTCTADESALQASKYVSFGSACPSSEWWVPLRAAGLRCRPLTLVNVGANKGFRVASWLSVLRPSLGICGARLKQEFSKVVHSWIENPDGACEDSREGMPAQGPDSEAPCPDGSADSAQPLALHAFEPLPGNADILRAYLEDLLPRGYPRALPIDYVVHEVAVTGDPALTKIEFGSCLQGNERCGVKVAQGPDDGDVYSKGRFVEATTIDAWLRAEGLDRLDVLAVDAEGHDPAVLKGADKLLAAGRVRILEFERHYLRDWAVNTVRDHVERLDGYGYECFLQQRGFLLRATGEGCWLKQFDEKDWGNLICALRAEEQLAAVLDSFTPIHAARAKAAAGLTAGGGADAAPP